MGRGMLEEEGLWDPRERRLQGGCRRCFAAEPGMSLGDWTWRDEGREEGYPTCFSVRSGPWVPTEHLLEVFHLNVIPVAQTPNIAACSEGAIDNRFFLPIWVLF